VKRKWKRRAGKESSHKNVDHKLKERCAYTKKKTARRISIGKDEGQTTDSKKQLLYTALLPFSGKGRAGLLRGKIEKSQKQTQGGLGPKLLGFDRDSTSFPSLSVGKVSHQMMEARASIPGV